jgi:dephospho-CoA kinase
MHSMSPPSPHDANNKLANSSPTMNCRYVVGLTGGIGSGKSTVADFFADQGIQLVDADLLAREVVEPGSAALPRIAEHFGARILLADGSLHRQLLREIIFSDAAEKSWLENLLHPVVSDLMKSRISTCASPYCLLVSPLLLETPQHEMVNRILVVDVRVETQLARTLKRDQSDANTIKAIIASQISRQDRLQRANDILDNELGLEQIETQVQHLHQNYLRVAKESCG